MKARFRPAILPFICFLCASPVTAFSAHNLFSKASWIWTSKPDAICHLRRVFTASAGIKSARIQISADNGYELYVNGSFVGSDVGAERSVWQSVETYDIGPLLSRGENVIAVCATDLGGQAGFLCAATIEFSGTEKLEFTSDTAWRVSSSSDPTGFAKSD